MEIRGSRVKGAVVQGRAAGSDSLSVHMYEKQKPWITTKGALSKSEHYKQPLCPHFLEKIHQEYMVYKVVEKRDVSGGTKFKEIFGDGIWARS